MRPSAQLRLKRQRLLAAAALMGLFVVGAALVREVAFEALLTDAAAATRSGNRSLSLLLLDLGLGLATLAVLVTLLWRSLASEVRAHAELGLRALEAETHAARMQAILRSGLDSIISVDASGRIIDFNPAAERLFGHRAEEVLGQDMCALLIPAAQRKAHQAGMHRHQLTGQSKILNQRIEVDALHANGGLIPVELTVTHVHTQAGDLYTATLRDLRERRRTEAERESLLQRYRETVAQNLRQRAALDQHAIVSITDAEGIILHANSKLCEVSGFSASELLGQPHSMLAPVLADAPLMRPQIWSEQGTQVLTEQIRRAVLRGETWEGELLHLRKNGTPFWAASTVVPMLKDDGSLGEVFVIQTDISSRVRAEQAVAQSRRQELTIGARIQQSLLVTRPDQRLPGAWVSSFNQASQVIDGDFVEVMKVGDHCVDIVVGDVMGKGVSAALMGAATKMAFGRSMAELVAEGSELSSLPQPSEIVQAVHRAMTPSLQALDAFVTLAYVRIDTQSRMLTWVGCGHEETLVVHPGQTPTSLPNQQPPLGVLESVVYGQDRCELAPDSFVFLSSDGLADAIGRDGRHIGQAAVRGALSARVRPGSTPTAALHSLRTDLLGSGVTLTDDMTMVMVSCPSGRDRTSRRELARTLDSLAHVRGLVGHRARLAGLSEDQASMFTLACVEAFTNVVRHAQAPVDDIPIELFVTVAEGCIEVELVHVAAPFKPDASRALPELADYPEGGFGLHIMQAASDEVRYTHHDGVCSVRLVKKA